MTPDEKAHFHWAEGMKYVAEGLKALFLLNGVSTISVLTFVGNEDSSDSRLVFSMCCFALGALFSIFSFFGAYLAQLKYGNSDFGAAAGWHNTTYVLVFFSMILFTAGVCLAGLAFLDFGLDVDHSLR